MMQRIGWVPLVVLGLLALDATVIAGRPVNPYTIWDPNQWARESEPEDPDAWLRGWAGVTFPDAEPSRLALPVPLSEPGWMYTLSPRLLDGRPLFLEDDKPAEPEGGVSQHRQTTQILGANLTSQTTVNRDRQRWEEPAMPYQPWKAEESVQMEVLGPFFAFGQFGAAPDTNPSRELRVSSRGGLGCKMEVLPGAEVQLRGGPVMTFRERVGGEEAQWLVEVQAKYALPLRLGLEYQGAAMPALNPAARDCVTQDVRLAMPLSDYGQFRVGARHQWENAPTYQPWGQGMQLYLGVELKRGAP
jgi:hypothetical protein